MTAKAGAPRERPGDTLLAYLLAGIYLLAAPLGLVVWIVGTLRARPQAKLIRAHLVTVARVDVDAIEITRDGVTESVPLAALGKGSWTIVDWGGNFAAANECGLLIELVREDGRLLRLGLEYYEEAQHRVELIDPLIERKLLRRQPQFVDMPGKLGLLGILVATTLWSLVVAALWPRLMR